MVDFVRVILRLAYWYGLAVGVLNFEVNWSTGKASASRRVTIYAVAHNLALMSLICLRSFSNKSLISDLTKARYLHEYFFLLMTLVRNMAVTISLVTRWFQRCRILRLWNKIFRMVAERPQVVHEYRRSLILKFVFVVLSDSFHTVLDLSAQRKKYNFDLVINIIIWTTFTTIFNMIVVQYYLAVLQVLGLYKIIQQDLRLLIREAETICSIRNRRGGVFSIKCCSLADQLDHLAERHSTLQNTISEMSEVFQIQSFSMSLVYYLSTMGSIYFTFCSILYNTTGFGSSFWGLLLIFLSTAFFYADNWISINIGFHIRDQQDELIRLLADRTLFSQELDKRLETAFENFQLQLVRDPYEFYVMGLFKVERGQLMAMLNSVITHSIILVQWELQHNRSEL
ncbi:putative gustatory receptor 59c [Drosophila subpulchrella]|uniref:putative gustatory receptor 59c n=1 Tax=Drosophila subpulchrella TaxID=1486046 RepID=UPI0018A1AE49|nr:putative gustatory receptor 59c [Drosophila subpulchrella]